MPLEVDLDFETRSNVDLSVVGLFNYATHSSTRVLLLSYSFDSQPEKIWRPHLESFPDELAEALFDPFCIKKSYNCSFERAIFKYVLGMDIPICEWRDIQVLARYYSLPGSLDDVSKIMELDQDTAKLEEGRALIRLFCEPFIDASASPLFGQSEPFFKDWRTNPDEWARFELYNRQDVRAEIAIAQKLKDFPLPAHEWRFWELDQKINDRGLPVNLHLVNGALQVVAREQTRLETQLKALTGVENVNSDKQILNWIKPRGYPFSKIGKAFVKRALEGEGNLAPEARECLDIRAQLSKSSVDKFSVFKTMTSPDGCLRNQFSFMGASRTGRYASRGINIQNLARPDKEVNDNLDVAVELLTNADYEGIQKTFKASVLDVASSCLRPVFRAPEGSRFIVADLNAIEPRVCAWIAGCRTILDIFNDGLDPYLSFASEIFQKPYKNINKTERQMAKPGFLGCSYRLSGGREIVNQETGDKEYTGLLAYGRMMGIELSKELADKSVSVFRSKYKEIKRFWYALEDAFVRAVRDGETVELDKLTFSVKKNVLCMGLPSGRNLHYINPYISENVLVQGEHGEYTKTALYHEGLSKKTNQWTTLETHGGVLIENATQAIARDVLMVGIERAENKGFEVCLHVHDEIGSVVPHCSHLTVKDLERAMSDPIKWANGLPLAAEGFENQYYRKG